MLSTLKQWVKKKGDYVEADEEVATSAFGPSRGAD